MTCYTPVTLYKSREGKNPLTGKWPLTSMNKGYRDKPQKVPCGKCVGCHLEYSRQWAMRCVHELQQHTFSSFITLTYEDDQLVWHEGAKRPTLHPRDLQLFWKRLRKEYGKGIRYFAAGEYGDVTGRPHYHAIVFGHDFPDKKFHSFKNGYIEYRSRALNDLWGHGDCAIGSATFESCAYVARYVLKKKYGQAADYYDSEKILPEFVRMSRRPGIGADWYEKFQDDVFPHDYVVIRGGIKCRPPKFYTNRYEKSHPLDIEQIKEERKIQASKKWRENIDARLNVRHEIARQKMNSLKRD